MDEDAALRILNFGDDYRNYIDSLSDGLSSCNEKKRPKKKFRKTKVPVIYLLILKSTPIMVYKGRLIRATLEAACFWVKN